MFPQSTGFGTIEIFEMVGACVFNVTVLVTVVDFPALSVETTVIVFSPSESINTFEKEPFS